MKTLSRVIIFLFLIFLPSIILGAQPKSNRVQKIIDRLVIQEDFQRQLVEKVFTDERIEIYKDILSIRKKSAGISYFDPIFGYLSPESQQKGRNFLWENLDNLKRAEKTFGVDKEVIVAVLAIETSFGKTLGQRSLFNTFYSLMVLDINPVLTQFAENEMMALFLMVRQEGGDIFEIKGSFMGAFGFPQFLPSSFLNYGVDGNDDGKVNLYLKEDAIFSIANYLQKNGYSRSSMYNKIASLIRYNNDRNYALAVLLYSTTLKQQ